MQGQGPVLRVRRYLTQKQGSSFDECEDALACRAATGACAIADGATEAFGARRWARLLVRAWVRYPDTGGAGFLRLVEELGRRAQKHWGAKRLPWYAEEKRQQGSHAAFIGVLFQQRGGALRWRAIALGDSCLFQLRGKELVAALPLSEPAQFGFRPRLVPSRLDAIPACAPHLGEFEGLAEPGDCFLLLSDAVACWFLEYPEARAEFVAQLTQGRSAELDRLVAAQRQAGRMRNDDIAAMAISFAPPS
jgi:hypothetical protein